MNDDDINKLVEVLRFYAKLDNWEKVIKDRGSLARQVLFITGMGLGDDP